MTTQSHHDRLLSPEYLDAVHQAWLVVQDLHKAGLPLARVVTRARNLYRQAWRDEKRRARAC